MDLAVLRLNPETEVEEVSAMMEFKAHMFLNNEQWPYEEFHRDVRKMHDLSGLARQWGKGDPDLYFVLLYGSPDKHWE